MAVRGRGGQRNDHVPPLRREEEQIARLENDRPQADVRGERVGVEVPWALSLRGSIGGAVGEYSFHDARGFHATIDHVFASVDEAGRWEAAAYAFTFLGARGFDHDESARFDHRVGLFALFEGERQLAGLSRAPAKRLSPAS